MPHSTADADVEASVSSVTSTSRAPTLTLSQVRSGVTTVQSPDGRTWTFTPTAAATASTASSAADTQAQTNGTANGG